MSSHEFKFGTTLFDFEQMICVTQGKFWRLKYNKAEDVLYRIGDRGFVPQSSTVTNAYLEYLIVDKILLGDNNE